MEPISQSTQTPTASQSSQTASALDGALITPRLNRSFQPKPYLLQSDAKYSQTQPAIQPSHSREHSFDGDNVLGSVRKLSLQDAEDPVIPFTQRQSQSQHQWGPSGAPFLEEEAARSFIRPDHVQQPRAMMAATPDSGGVNRARINAATPPQYQHHSFTASAYPPSTLSHGQLPSASFTSGYPPLAFQPQLQQSSQQATVSGVALSFPSQYHSPASAAQTFTQHTPHAMLPGPYGYAHHPHLPHQQLNPQPYQPAPQLYSHSSFYQIPPQYESLGRIAGAPPSQTPGHFDLTSSPDLSGAFGDMDTDEDEHDNGSIEGPTISVRNARPNYTRGSSSTRLPLGRQPTSTHMSGPSFNTTSQQHTLGQLSPPSNLWHSPRSQQYDSPQSAQPPLPAVASPFSDHQYQEAPVLAAISSPSHKSLGPVLLPSRKRPSPSRDERGHGYGDDGENESEGQPGQRLKKKGRIETKKDATSLRRVSPSISSGPGPGMASKQPGSISGKTRDNPEKGGEASTGGTTGLFDNEQHVHIVNISCPHPNCPPTKANYSSGGKKKDKELNKPYVCAYINPLNGTLCTAAFRRRGCRERHGAAHSGKEAKDVADSRLSPNLARRLLWETCRLIEDGDWNYLYTTKHHDHSQLYRPPSPSTPTNHHFTPATTATASDQSAYTKSSAITFLEQVQAGRISAKEGANSVYISQAEAFERIKAEFDLKALRSQGEEVKDILLGWSIRPATPLVENAALVSTGSQQMPTITEDDISASTVVTPQLAVASYPLAELDLKPFPLFERLARMRAATFERYFCPENGCDVDFTRLDALQRHVVKSHGSKGPKIAAAKKKAGVTKEKRGARGKQSRKTKNAGSSEDEGDDDDGFEGDEWE